jgi:hypothetical protein
MRLGWLGGACVAGALVACGGGTGSAPARDAIDAAGSAMPDASGGADAGLGADVVGDRPSTLDAPASVDADACVPDLECAEAGDRMTCCEGALPAAAMRFDKFLSCNSNVCNPYDGVCMGACQQTSTLSAACLSCIQDYLYGDASVAIGTQLVLEDTFSVCRTDHLCAPFALCAIGCLP